MIEQLTYDNPEPYDTSNYDYNGRLLARVTHLRAQDLAIWPKSHLTDPPLRW